MSDKRFAIKDSWENMEKSVRIERKIFSCWGGKWKEEKRKRGNGKSIWEGGESIKGFEGMNEWTNEWTDVKTNERI